MNSWDVWNGKKDSGDVMGGMEWTPWECHVSPHPPHTMLEMLRVFSGLSMTISVVT